MSYQATDFLAGLYADRPTASTPEAASGTTDSPATMEPVPSQAGPTADLSGPGWDDCIDPGDPCPRCGSLAVWQPIVGEPRCLGCDPPTAGIRALEAAQRIRRRHGIPDPSGVAELLAAPKMFAGGVAIQATDG